MPVVQGTIARSYCYFLQRWTQPPAFDVARHKHKTGLRRLGPISKGPPLRSLKWFRPVCFGAMVRTSTKQTESSLKLRNERSTTLIAHVISGLRPIKLWAELANTLVNTPLANAAD